MPWQERLGDLADGFDPFAAVEEANDPAGAGLQPLVAPWKCADKASLIENCFYIAADIFGVN